jgi:DNA repair photolyase
MAFQHEHGRGAGLNPPNRFERTEFAQAEWSAIDELPEPLGRTEFIPTYPSSMLNAVDSPDIGPALSMNPYQGCEHGCAYCYARNAHEYWGYSAGVDFEQKILVKHDAAAVLRRELMNKNYRPQTIMLSGNTDCYQPAERRFGITRQILELLLAFRHPVSIITKNALILRDVDVLARLAELNLVHVNLSLTTADKHLRRVLEPRTSSYPARLKAIERLTSAGVPVGVMTAPVIPGLNSHELPSLLEDAARAGALSAGYTVCRLNGQLAVIFEEWLRREFPDRAEKVLARIRACHDGQLNDSEFGRRMHGAGPEAESIRSLFRVARRKHFAGRAMPPYDFSHFCPPQGCQGDLFG